MSESLVGKEWIMRRETSVVGTLEWSVFPKSSSVQSMPYMMGLRTAVSLAGGDELARKEPYACLIWSRRRRLLE